MTGEFANFGSSFLTELNPVFSKMSSLFNAPTPSNPASAQPSATGILSNLPSWVKYLLIAVVIVVIILIIGYFLSE